VVVLGRPFKNKKAVLNQAIIMFDEEMLSNKLMKKQK
jgi:hypothetical protein